LLIVRWRDPTSSHQRTLWLGTMNAAVLGVSEPPLKNLQAVTISDERKGCQQIDVAGIVTPVADFPAH
jgi:hypothetical protein